MVENSLVTFDHSAIAEYWQHLSRHVPWAQNHVSDNGLDYVPLFLWGDDAQYNKRADKLITVCMGMVLDTRDCSRVTIWPLFCYRHDARHSSVSR